jgi:hypothetical protein
MGGETASRKAAGTFFPYFPTLGVSVCAGYLPLAVWGSPRCGLRLKYASTKARNRTLG